jgi:hypothetical protein
VFWWRPKIESSTSTTLRTMHSNRKTTKHPYAQRSTAGSLLIVSVIPYCWERGSIKPAVSPSAACREGGITDRRRHVKVVSRLVCCCYVTIQSKLHITVHLFTASVTCVSVFSFIPPITSLVNKKWQFRIGCRTETSRVPSFVTSEYLRMSANSTILPRIPHGSTR